MKIYKYIPILLLLGIVLFSCVDELDINTLGDGDDGAGILVVEAVFSDELKTQEVFLGRSGGRLDLETDTIYNPFIPLGTQPYDSVTVETGAQIKLVAKNGTEYGFIEGRAGQYLSDQMFSLETDMEYTLEISTGSGKEYVSDVIGLSGTSEITGVYAEKAVSESGVEGIAIYADSNPIEGSPEHYRYDYEETYKIIAPYWSEYDFKLTDYNPNALPIPTYNLEIIEREVQNRVCYNTVSSSAINLVNNNKSKGSTIKRHLVRFIGRDNFIISHRYSILVKQYVQSQRAYTFYEVLKKFSQSEGLFSSVQPGALYANVKRVDGEDENVFGYVEAVNVSEKRLFFNFEDFFPGEELPPYAFGYNCQFGTVPLFDVLGCPQGLLARIDLGLVNYYSEYDELLVPIAACPGPYIFVPKLCGDCTFLGSNIAPEFWEE